MSGVAGTFDLALYISIPVTKAGHSGRIGSATGLVSMDVVSRCDRDETLAYTVDLSAQEDRCYIWFGRGLTS